jgi:hypothetical protein
MTELIALETKGLPRNKISAMTHFDQTCVQGRARADRAKSPCHISAFAIHNNVNQEKTGGARGADLRLNSDRCVGGN